ncbi:MAG: hypothetical protein ABSD38_20835 [Syntrophorhabdales bacterium]|jgi:hypothetical protein
MSWYKVELTPELVAKIRISQVEAGFHAILISHDVGQEAALYSTTRFADGGEIFYIYCDSPKPDVVDMLCRLMSDILGAPCELSDPPSPMGLEAVIVDPRLDDRIRRALSCANSKGI